MCRGVINIETGVRIITFEDLLKHLEFYGVDKIPQKEIVFDYEPLDCSYMDLPPEDRPCICHFDLLTMMDNQLGWEIDWYPYIQESMMIPPPEYSKVRFLG